MSSNNFRFVKVNPELIRGYELTEKIKPAKRGSKGE